MGSAKAEEVFGLGRRDGMALTGCVMRAVSWFAPQYLPLWQGGMVEICQKLSWDLL